MTFLPMLNGQDKLVAGFTALIVRWFVFSGFMHTRSIVSSVSYNANVRSLPDFDIGLVPIGLAEMFLGFQFFKANTASET